MLPANVKKKPIIYFLNKEIEELKTILTPLSSNSEFEDDMWVLDKTAKNQSKTKGGYTLYFHQTPVQYVEWVKVFALMRLASRRGPSTVSSNIYAMNHFLRFLDSNKISLKKVNKRTIYAYLEHLNSSKYTRKTKETLWAGLSLFFCHMTDFDEVPKVNITNQPFYENSRLKEKLDSKYIQEDVLLQLDSIFRDENIPLVLRTAYWLCRLIPNRITEVCSMRIDCIKPYINEKVLLIPMFKQNGGHNSPEMRQIALKDEGMGEYLLELVRRQIDASKALQEYVNTAEDKDFLFTYLPPFYLPKQSKYKDEFNYSPEQKRDKVVILNGPAFNRMLKALLKRHKVLDSHRELVNVSSHMFRHNAITDRLYEGFRVIDIMSITNHKSSGMITQNYLHVKEEELKTKAEKVLNEEKPEVLFRGRIINTNPEKMNQILKRPFAHKIGRLGICSDISNCPSEMFECLSCHNFVPNANELEYFEEQVKQWEEKLARFGNHPFMKENAEYNLRLNKQIIEKITNGISE